MQECDACGLLFGGAEECPSCGSRISHTAAENIEDGRHGRPAGPLPGESALDDAIAGVQGLDLSLTQITQTSTPSSLPFQVGGKGQIASALPFGVGAPAGIAIEGDDDAFPEPQVPESTPISDSESDDPWAMPEVEPSPVLQASISPVNEQSETPLVVLQARTVTTEEEQLSESPVLVENAYQIKAAAFDAEHVYAVDEEVVIHDFDDEQLVTEIVVNFDELVDPAEQTVRFNPELLSEGEPELMPAKALSIEDGGDDKIAGHTIAAFEALGDGRWKDAADGFRIVCNSLPGDSAALNNFGLSLLQLAIQVHEGNPTETPAEEPHFEAAVLALRQAAQQDKYNPTILYNLATCLATCERHGVANRIWDATISLAPENAAPLNGKAVSLIALNEYDAATTLLMQAREISPSEPVILRNLRRLRPTI